MEIYIWFNLISMNFFPSKCCRSFGIAPTSSLNAQIVVRHIISKRALLLHYPSTLANSTLIILFSEMLKFSKKYFFQIKKYNMKDNNEYLRIFHLSK
jgi:hypothetical protein